MDNSNVQIFDMDSIFPNEDVVRRNLESTFLHAMLASILFRANPDEARFILIDFHCPEFSMSRLSDRLKTQTGYGNGHPCAVAFKQ